jgi:hypothetical protein
VIRILGFEGVVGDALVAYGAAAVELPDGTILNSSPVTVVWLTSSIPLRQIPLRQ